jgi:hypothetical protein
MSADFGRITRYPELGPDFRLRGSDWPEVAFWERRRIVEIFDTFPDMTVNPSERKHHSALKASKTFPGRPPLRG